MQAPSAAPPVPPVPGVVQVTPAQLAGGNPSAVYRAAEAARSELRSQLEGLEDKRRQLSSQLRDGGRSAADKTGVESRMADIDKRIGDVEKQIAAADQAVVKAAGVPGAVVETPRPSNDNNGPPEGPFIVGALFIVVVLLPLSLAFARRIWRRGKDAVVSFPQELSDRLNRLDQAVDSIAVEVERIGEGQRFVTRVLAENGTGRSLGSGAAMPIDAGARDRARVAREGERGTL